MRIAIFTSQFPGRVNTFFARDIRGLLDAGIDIEIFTLYPLENKYWDLVPDILNKQIFPRNKVHHLENLQSLKLASQTSPMMIKKVFDNILTATASSAKFGPKQFAKTQYAIIKALAFNRSLNRSFDHILAYWGNYAATCALFFNQLLKYPKPFSMFLHAGTDLYRNQIYMKEKLLYSDNIFVVCEFNRRFLKGLYPDIYDRISSKIKLHHLGLDLKNFVCNLDDRPPGVVLGVGRLEYRKGFDHLIQAAAQVIDRGVQLKVELIGDGPQKEALKALADNLGIRDKVVFRGWLPFEKVKKQMANATLLVHPSTELGDAVPTVIKEAMALGTPVIASDIVGIPELLDGGKCGILVPPKNSQSIANSIELLLADDQKRREFAIAGREFVENNLNLWKNGKKLANILRSSRSNR